jgi:hypothetical protein
MRGQAVCASHGGRASQNRAAGARREAERRASQALAARGVYGPVHDPLEQLARVAGEILAMKDMLAEQVGALGSVLTYWTERTYDDGDTLHTAAVENVRATVAAYERSLDRTARVLAVMAKLDIEGRMLEVNTAKAALIVGAIERGLAACELPAETVHTVKGALADEIGALSERRRSGESQA